MAYSEYSDYSESEDEYAPLQMSGWGTQKVTEEGKTEVNVSMDDWASLIDPSVKLKSNGIGTGQLHRQGKNFKPVDEQLILDRRLGKPLPKGGLNGGKKKKKSKSGQPPPPPPPPPQQQQQQQQQQQKQQQKAPKPSKPSKPLSVAPRRPPVKAGSNAWTTDKLMETPFWNNPNGTSASKYAPSQPSQPPQHQRPQQQPTQTWRQQPHSQPQQQQHWNQQQQQQQQQPQAPSWSQPQTQQVPSWQQQQQQPLGTMASKYATAAPSQSPVQTQPPQYQQQQQQQHYMPPAASNTPCLTFKIELAPGVTANLPVYPNDNPSDVVSQFEKNHHLVMSDAAKARFAERVAMLLSQYNK